MGLASSSYREFFFINRKNTIECELNHNALMKTSLTREMNKISQEYQNALNTKTLKWSNNNGVTYQDLTYSSLMSPSAMNNQKPYLITDNSDRVVIASNYKKYAEMISPKGAPGGDYESNRTQILSEILGIDQDKINKSGMYSAAMSEAGEELEAAKAERDAIPKRGCKGATASVMLESLGNSSALGTSWKEEYSKKTSKVELGGDSSSASSKLGSILDELKSLAPYLGDYGEKFKTEIDKVKAECDGLLKSLSKDSTPNEESCCYLKDGIFYTNVTSLVDCVLSKLPDDAVATTNTGYQGKTKYEFWPNTSDYNNYKNATKAADDKIAEIQSRYNSAATSESQLMTADEERKIKFYDAIFTAIADKGWTYNEDISDNTHLNEMLQNGAYYLTTMEQSVYTDGKNEDGTAKFKYEYSTGIAENDDHVYKVNDSSEKDIAIAIYEDKKRIINAKETRIDNRTNNLQTELSAIQQMLQSLDTVENDNIERTMSWCG